MQTSAVGECAVTGQNIGCELYDALLLCTNVYPNVTLTESL